MSEIQELYIPFEKGSLIQRRHKRDVDPPGVVTLKNFITMSSDDAVSLRNDFTLYDFGQGGIYGASGDLILQNSDTNVDILNTVSGIYGSEDIVYFTSYVPYGLYGGEPAILSDTYTTGDVTGSEGSFAVSFASLGSGIDLEKKCWKGCILRILTKYYEVDDVIASDSSAETGTVILTMPLEDDHTAESDYAIYFNHNPRRASQYKLNTAPFGSAIIYGVPYIGSDFSAKDICGPFYTNVTETDWRYGGRAIRQYDIVGTGVANAENFYTLATNGTTWIKCLPYAASSSQADDNEANWYTSAGGSFFKTLDITSTYFEWQKIEFDDVTLNIPQPNGDDELQYFFLNSIKRNSSLGYLSAAHTHIVSETGPVDAQYPAIAHSDDDGVTWTVKPDYHFDGSDWQCVSAEYDGTTITAVMWKSSDDTIELRYSTDGGASWNDCVTNQTWTGTEQAKVTILDGDFIVCGGDGAIYISADGQTFGTKKDISADPDMSNMDTITDIAYNGVDYWIVVNGDGNVAGCATVDGTYVDKSPTWTGTFNFVFYDPIGQRFIIPNEHFLLSTDDDGSNWIIEPTTSFGVQHRGEATSNIDYSGALLAYFTNHGESEGGSTVPIEHVVLSRTYQVAWEVSKFVPVSETYRATTFAVLDGYNVLMGTREYLEHDPDNDAGHIYWKYFPRRIRWSYPADFDDFSTAGSGTADLKGAGAILDSVVVNGRIVTIETSSLGALVPRGDTTDPWDYDIIKENFRVLSNPVAVDDLAYFIGSDGLLWKTDGIEVSELGASFDLTKFDDFRDDKPTWLTYSRKLNALLVYYPDFGATASSAYAISLANGSVSEITLQHITDDAGEKSIVPGSIVCIEGSDVQKTFVSHHPTSDDTDKIVVGELEFGEPIFGYDECVTDDKQYFYGEIVTGELFIVPEGMKTSVKHIIVDTYTEGDNTGNELRPRVALQVRSIEDDEWHDQGDFNATITMDTSTTALVTGTLTGTALTGEGEQSWAAGEAIELPILNENPRIYVYSGGEYHYQTPGTDYIYDSGYALVQTGTTEYPTNIIYVFYDGEPEVRISSGDIVSSTEGYHIIESVGTLSGSALSLDHGLSSGTDATATHIPATIMPDGEGRIAYGMNKLVEGLQVRIIVIPNNGGNVSEIAKIKGITIGHIPRGRKILQATGD